MIECFKLIKLRDHNEKWEKFINMYGDKNV